MQTTYFSLAAAYSWLFRHALKGQKQLWRTSLEGAEVGIHSEYSNVVRLEQVNDEVLAVYGEENVPSSLAATSKSWT